MVYSMINHNGIGKCEGWERENPCRLNKTIELPYDPAIQVLCIEPEELKTGSRIYIYVYIYTYVHSSISHNRQKVETTQVSISG